MRNLVFAALAALCLALPAYAQSPAQGTLTTTTCNNTGTIAAQETGCVFVFVDLPAPRTPQSVIVEVSGTFQGALCFEGAAGTTFTFLRAYPTNGSGSPASCVTTPGIWQVNSAGTQKVRVHALALDSGSPVVTLVPSVIPVTPPSVSITGVDPSGNQKPLAATPQGAIYVLPVSPPLNPFLPRCNAVRTTQCQP